MTEADADPPSLRDRKKQATRAAISAAALRLALEQGLDKVRVEAIAAAAGVSPRTYNNYFSSREEAIRVALSAERMLRLGAGLRARPPEEPLAEAIVEALTSAGPDSEQRTDKDRVRLIACAPAMRGEFLKLVTEFEATLAEAIAARINADPERDLHPRVLAAAVAGAARVATEEWLRPGNTAAFADLLRHALGCIMPTAPADRRDA